MFFFPLATCRINLFLRKYTVEIVHLVRLVNSSVVLARPYNPEIINKPSLSMTKYVKKKYQNKRNHCLLKRELILTFQHMIYMDSVKYMNRINKNSNYMSLNAITYTLLITVVSITKPLNK